MHGEGNFSIKSVDSNSARIELAPDFTFPPDNVVWLEVGTNTIGSAPSTAPSLKALADATNNKDADADSATRINWRRYKKISSQKRRLRLKSLQPNLLYHVKLGASQADYSHDVKSFWTEDWHDSCKSEAVVDKGVDFGNFYILGKRLGRGHFGDVHLCAEKQASPELQDSAWVYAVKIMRVARRQQIEVAQNEVAVLRELRHINVVWLKQAIWAPKSTLYLVMEYIAGGELFEKISGDDYLLTELECAEYLHQICQALSYVHDKSIVHLDLKVENIMLACPQRRQIKVVDFGIARTLTPGVPCKVMCGTAEFCAPEVLAFDPISFRTDMWSVGVVAYIMLSGLSPFLGDNDAETHSNVVMGEFTFDDPAFDTISEPAKDFISKLIVKQKEQRMTAEKCLSHEWLVAASKSFDEPTITSGPVDDTDSILSDDVDGTASTGRRMSMTAIDTTKLRAYWARRKWKKACGVLRAVQRISSSWRCASGTVPLSVAIDRVSLDSVDGSKEPPNSTHQV